MTWKRFSLSRVHRVEAYLSSLYLPKSFLKQEEASLMYQEVFVLITKLKRLQSIQILFYFAIYFSLVSYLLSYLGLFENLVDLLSSFFAFVGTTLFIILAFLNHKLIEANYQDLMLRVSHLFSLQVRKLKPSEKLFKEEQNSYLSFLEYFSKKE